MNGSNNHKKDQSATLFEDIEEDRKSSSNHLSKKRKGPPNRMNDLNYSTWMKYQKSFFRWNGLAHFAYECANFFTKKTWNDGRHGNILLIGDEELRALTTQIEKPRIVDYYPAKSVNSAIQILKQEKSNSRDYILISILKENDYGIEGIINIAREMCVELNRALIEEKYCTVILPTKYSSKTGFPFVWSWATAARHPIRLRDEKVGVLDSYEEPIYCLYFQSIKDEFGSKLILPKDLKFEKQKFNIPYWIIPKPPPRKPNEILHPAKFPETLIEEFISIFTNEGDTVLDPMLGTGSTLVAAKNQKRNGIGIELIPEFSDIAKQRIEDSVPPLFEDSSKIKLSVITDDARNLSKIKDLSIESIDYCITSPPLLVNAKKLRK